jgi:hypothetical protein
MFVKASLVAGKIRTLEAEIHLLLLGARTDAARREQLAFFIATPATAAFRQMIENLLEFRVFFVNRIVQQINKALGEHLEVAQGSLELTAQGMNLATGKGEATPAMQSAGRESLFDEFVVIVSHDEVSFFM